MSFFTFLLYFTGSMVIWYTVSFLIINTFKFFAQRRFNNKVKNGEIKMMTMDELIEKIQDGKQPGDDGTWH